MNFAEKKKVLLLGATGSIGKSALAVFEQYSDLFELVGVAAGSNVEHLAGIVNKFSPGYTAIADTGRAKELKDLIEVNSKLYVGSEGIIELIRECNADICISAIVGSSGLLPTMTAIQEGMDIALANKESLVAAGDLLMKLAEEYKVEILPVDSEHSGLLQCMLGGKKKEIAKVIITASGGAFRDYSLLELSNVTPEQALCHPTWTMGKKITIDCATLANKGLEVIEAHWLFDLSYDEIEIIIHRESIIHAMVEYCDGSIIAQLATANMSLPILYALTYPQRLDYQIKRLNFAEIGSFSFTNPDTDIFPMLKLAYMAGRVGGLTPTVYSAANEEAVNMFLAKQIGFTDIYKCVEYALGKIKTNLPVTLDNILSTESIAHSYVRDFISK